MMQNSRVSWVQTTTLERLLCVGHNSRLKLFNSSFTNNWVRPLEVGDQASVVLHACNLSRNNIAYYGGGLRVLGNATVTLSGGSSISNNTAAKVSSVGDNTGGGGVFVGENATFTLSGGSSITNNTSGSRGGGLYVNGTARVALSGGSSISHNTAANTGGGVGGTHNVSVTLTGGSSISNNVAGAGGGLFLMQGPTINITGGSSVHGNRALMTVGGGVYCWIGKIYLDNSMWHDNSAGLNGGGGYMDKATFGLANNSSLHSNRALHGSGGGVFIFGGVLIIRDGSSIVNNSCTPGVGGGVAAGVWVFKEKSSNPVGTFSFGSMGRLVAQEGASDDIYNSRVMISNSIVANNTSNGAAGGGFAIASWSVIALANGTKVLGNRAFNGSGGAVLLMGNATLQADGTVVFQNKSGSRGFVGSAIVAFEDANVSLPTRGQLTKCNTSVYLGTATCAIGEVLQHDVCNCCPPHTFSFANSSCTQCPPNAACPGASVVEPLPGFWSSAPTSIQMHRCPLFKTACDYVNETHTCKPGYQGALCGDCHLPDYGVLSPMRCGRCMQPAVQLGLYVGLNFVTVSFVTYTVHATWQDNLEGTWDVQVTDYIKVLVQFLQYIVIIGSVSVPWPFFDVQMWLQAIGVVVTMGSGQALSLDCWLYRYGRKSIPMAIQRLLVYFLAPVFTLVLVLALQWLAWAVQFWLVPLWKPRGVAGIAQGPLQLLLRKLPVTLLVLVYYAYPLLLRASLSFFACLSIDKPLGAFANVPAGATALLSHTWGYWVSSIQQECFAGYHLRWAMGLGLPSVLLWCLVVPVAMGVGLYVCRHRADSASFREHFGFLYRTYKPKRLWWEAVWAARTVVLTVISVFSFPMQRYFSVLSLLLVFWASAALQSYFKPYESPSLHRMHLVSTSCLAATTVGALAMFAYDIQESTAFALRIAITVLVFVINLVFVGWCCVKMAPDLKEWLGSRCAWVLACAGHSSARRRRGASGARRGRATSSGCFKV
jgi:hypothetical protein